ncbi:MAG: caspase family protein [Gemmataceae bacterium]|nr:caspase family protein [Gemmataceae bacterium]
MSIQLPPEKDRPVLVLDARGHTGPVTRALFTPDGKRIITTSTDKTARLWDAATGECLWTFRLPVGRGSEGAIYGAAISPDGKWLVVGGMPFGGGVHGTLIHVISLQTGQVARVIRDHKDVSRAFAFSPGQGTYLATGGDDRLAFVFDLTTGKPVRAFVHKDRVRQVAWHPNGRLLATATMEGTAHIWDFAGGKPVADLPDNGSFFQSVAWSPDGNTLAVGARDSTLHLWTPLGKPLKVHRDPELIQAQHKLQLSTIAFTPDGRSLVYAGVDSTGRAGVIDPSTGKRRVIFPHHDNTVRHGSVSPDGKLAITTGGDRQETFIWKVADGEVVQKLVGVGQSVWAVGWSRDGRTIAWGNTNRDSGINAAPLEGTFRLDRLELGGAPTEPFLRAAHQVASGWSLQQLDFFRVAIKRQGQLVHTFTSPVKQDRIYSYSILTNDRALIGASAGLWLIDMKTNRVLRRLKGHSGSVLTISPSPDGRLVLTGGEDQTLCLWDVERELPLMSLFIGGSEWIAWTPEGYYACSPQGERLMGWQINNGPDRMATYYPAVQFRQSLYQPEVIRLLRRAGSLGKALAAAGQGKAIAAVNVTQVLPPQVAITAPGSGGQVTVNQQRVEVRAVAKSNGKHPVKSMRLLVDGRPYQGQNGIRAFADDGLADRKASWQVDLTPGKHVLAVQAESPVSKGLSAQVEVVCTGGKEKGLPDLYVLACGVSEYEGDMKLAFAAKDAMVLAKTFRERTGGVFGKVEVRLLTDKEATRKNILDGLEWLGSVMTAKDVGVVFFAGHGTQDPRGNFHLVPVDFNPSDPGGTCVAGDLLKKALGNMPGRLIAMFDACHSGAAALGKASPGKKRPPRKGTDDLARDLVTDDYGVVVMCSSQGHESSLESSLTEHGFFTLGVVEALGGKADFNRDRIIHIHELDAYAFLRVRQLSRGQQNPVTGRPPTIRSFPLGRF